MLAHSGSGLCLDQPKTWTKLIFHLRPTEKKTQSSKLMRILLNYRGSDHLIEAHPQGRGRHRGSSHRGSSHRGSSRLTTPSSSANHPKGPALTAIGTQNHSINTALLITLTEVCFSRSQVYSPCSLASCTRSTRKLSPTEGNRTALMVAPGIGGSDIAQCAQQRLRNRLSARA